MDWGDGLAPTWIVASDSRGAAEDLPQERGVLPAVLHEHILQGLRPVELIEDDSGWRVKQGAGVGSTSAVPPLNLITTPTHVPPTQKVLCLLGSPSLPRAQLGLHQLLHEDILVLIPSQETAQSALSQGPT